MVIRDKRVGYMSTVSAGDKQEAGEAGVGGASVKCGDSRLDEGRRWRRGVGWGGQRLMLLVLFL